MKALLLLGSILSFLIAVDGNTEIVNFAVKESLDVNLEFKTTWPKLTARSSSLQWNITSAPLGSVLSRTICGSLNQWRPENPQPCPHELWLQLDLDDEEWKGFDKFTLRLSWPAFHPTQVTMDIYDPISLGDFSVNSPSPNAIKTRRKYARIQMVHSGVLTPGIVLDNNSRYEVPFVLILEPLYLGIIPKSFVPVVFAFIVVIPVGLLTAMKINSNLQYLMKDPKWDFVDQCKND